MLPQEVRVVLQEVTVQGGLAEDWLLELELLNDTAWLQVELLVDDIDQAFVSEALGDGAVCVDVHRDWVWDADTVSDLHQDSFTELVVDQRLGDPSGSISAGSVDLGAVLSGESTT